MAYKIVSINISEEEYLKWYRGSASFVQANSTDGKRIRFPANILQPFVTREGVHGVFAIYFDENNKFKAIKRLE